MEHEADLTAVLSDRERAELVRLLARIADDAGLVPGVYPGYRTAQRQPRQPRRSERQ
jgi:hypothetical protein